MIEPNAENRYEVTRESLPLACPMPGMYLWSSHPKVYLAIHKTGEATCPYCGAEFVLTDFDADDDEIRRLNRRDI
nr:zinc-finger domain-containing protein [Natronocella acetinitrilica]